MVEDRSCRDVLFLLLFAAYWAGMLYVAGIAFREGARAVWAAARRQRAAADSGAAGGQ